MYVEENVCCEEARREGIKMARNSLSYVLGRVRSLSQEAGNQRLREPHKTRSAKRTSAAEQKREQRIHAAPQNSASLSSLAAHPTSSPSNSRPVRCALSSTTCHLEP